MDFELAELENKQTEARAFYERAKTVKRRAKNVDMVEKTPETHRTYLNAAELCAEANRAYVRARNNVLYYKQGKPDKKRNPVPYTAPIYHGKACPK